MRDASRRQRALSGCRLISAAVGIALNLSVCELAEAQGFPSILGIPTATLQQIFATPAQIVSDTGSAMVSAAVPDKPALVTLGAASDTADLLRAYQSGGVNAEWNTVAEKSFVQGATVAGSSFGTPGRIAAAGVAQFSYDVGKFYIAPALAPKIADIWVGLDQRFGITANGQYLQQAAQQTALLQQRVDEQNMLRSSITNSQSSLPSAGQIPQQSANCSIVSTFCASGNRSVSNTAATRAIVTITPTVAPSAPTTTVSIQKTATVGTTTDNASTPGVVYQTDEQRAAAFKAAGLTPAQQAAVISGQGYTPSQPPPQPMPVPASNNASAQSTVPITGASSNKPSNNISTADKSLSAPPATKSLTNFASLGVTTQNLEQVRVANSVSNALPSGTSSGVPNNAMNIAALHPTSLPVTTTVWNAPGRPSVYRNVTQDNFTRIVRLPPQSVPASVFYQNAPPAGMAIPRRPYVASPARNYYAAPIPRYMPPPVIVPHFAPVFVPHFSPAPFIMHRR